MKKGEIRMDSRNARVHDQRNKEAIRTSLAELGAGRGPESLIPSDLQ